MKYYNVVIMMNVDIVHSEMKYLKTFKCLPLHSTSPQVSGLLAGPRKHFVMHKYKIKTKRIAPLCPTRMAF